MKRSAKKLLVASLLAGSLVAGNTASAEEFSGNTVEINANEVDFNGVRVQEGLTGGDYTVTADTSEGTGDISWNRITINGGSLTLYVNGGLYTGSLIGNQIILNVGRLYVTAADALTFGGTIQGNVLRINGGNFENSYLYLPNIVAANNVVELNGKPILDNVYLFGGILGDTDNASGNILNVNGVGLTAKNIYDFDILNFNLPASVQNGDIALTLTEDATDISNRTVNATVAGGTNLKAGDSVQLLFNPNGLNTTGTIMNGRLGEGVTLSYDTVLTATPYGLIMTLNQPRVEEQTRALNQGAIVPANEISRGTQSLIDALPVEDFEPGGDSEGSAKLMMISNSWGIFTDTSGGKLRTKTGNGSYVQSRGNGFGLGFARASENPNGSSFIVAPVFDYGKSKYDSYLSDGTHGHGKSKYFMGGLFFRKMNSNGFYFEGSFRGGKSDIDFSSNDLFSGLRNVGVGYDDSTPAFAGHVRIGKLKRIDRNNLLHVYGIYSHTHTNGIDTKISTGEKYSFDSVDSGAFQLGYRLTTAVSPISKIYTGLAWQYQFNGSTSATYRGFTTPEAGIKGSTGILELGWQIRPRRTNPWALDINITGRIGLQKGITASAGVRKAF